MNTLANTGPPRRRATQSPSQGTGIGADKQLQLIQDDIKRRYCSQPDHDDDFGQAAPALEDPRQAQLLAIVTDPACSEDTREAALADLWKEFPNVTPNY